MREERREGEGEELGGRKFTESTVNYSMLCKEKELPFNDCLKELDS